LYADTVIYAQWKTGKNAAGWISGLQLFPLKIGFVVRGVAIPALLAAAGFVSGMTAEESTLSLQEGI
jgi:GPH family glycoside/pentoside/hexuronide:cation symporter